MNDIDMVRTAIIQEIGDSHFVRRNFPSWYATRFPETETKSKRVMVSFGSHDQ